MSMPRSVSMSHSNPSLRQWLRLCVYCVLVLALPLLLLLLLIICVWSELELEQQQQQHVVSTASDFVVACHTPFGRQGGKCSRNDLAKIFGVGCAWPAEPEPTQTRHEPRAFVVVVSDSKASNCRQANWRSRSSRRRRSKVGIRQ